MGKVFKAGEGAFRAVYKKEQLEKLGYISAKKANDLILSYLCDGTYENGGVEKYLVNVLCCSVISAMSA